jgi:hypothetical protein
MAGLNGTITLQSGLGALVIAKDLTISGPGPTVITVSGNSVVQDFNISSGFMVKISGLTIANGYTSGTGGGILNAGTLTLEGCTVKNNGAQDGAGVYSTGTLTVTNTITTQSMITFNNATRYGGGIYSSGMLSVLNLSTVSNNMASTNGGGIYNTGTTTIDNSMIGNGNTATSGGGIYNAATTYIQHNSIISRNTASGSGGGIENEGSLTISSLSTVMSNTGNSGGGVYSSNATTLLTIVNSTFKQNKASATGGGAVYFAGSPMCVITPCVITAATFIGNSAPTSFVGSGGAIENAGSLTVAGSTLSSNAAALAGGAIYNVGSGANLTIDRSTLDGNGATDSGIGGGIDNENSAMLTITKSTISNNSASGSSGFGGGINNSATLTVDNSTFSGNQAVGVFNGGQGGGLRNTSSATVTCTTFYGNSASGPGQPPAGGGIYQGAGSLMILNTIVANNTASVGPDVSGMVMSQGYNFIGKKDGSSGWTMDTDYLGTIQMPIDPMLNPLADNGGPTKTHLPQWPASQVIDAGNPNVSYPTDQRVMPRLYMGKIDIGSVELQASERLAPATAVERQEEPTQGILMLPRSAGVIPVTEWQASTGSYLADFVSPQAGVPSEASTASWSYGQKATTLGRRDRGWLDIYFQAASTVSVLGSDEVGDLPALGIGF